MGMDNEQYDLMLKNDMKRLNKIRRAARRMVKEERDTKQTAAELHKELFGDQPEPKPAGGIAIGKGATSVGDGGMMIKGNVKGDVIMPGGYKK